MCIESYDTGTMLFTRKSEVVGCGCGRWWLGQGARGGWAKEIKTRVRPLGSGHRRHAVVRSILHNRSATRRDTSNYSRNIEGSSNASLFGKTPAREGGINLDRRSISFHHIRHFAGAEFHHLRGKRLGVPPNTCRQ